MDKFVAGTVVAITFPFSNLKGQKVRPALVVAQAELNNLILCQITSKPYSSRIAIQLDELAFAEGRLPIVSYTRPDKLFTSDASIIHKKIGHLSDSFLETVLSQVRDLFTRMK